MGMDTAAFHYIQNKENVSLGVAKASTDFKKSHAGTKMSLFKNVPVGPCFAWSVCCFCCHRNCAYEGQYSVNPLGLKNIFAELLCFGPHWTTASTAAGASRTVDINPAFCCLPSRWCCCWCWWSSWPWCFLWPRAAMEHVSVNKDFLVMQSQSFNNGCDGSQTGKSWKHQEMFCR